MRKRNGEYVEILNIVRINTGRVMKGTYLIFARIGMNDDFYTCKSVYFGFLSQEIEKQAKISRSFT